MHGIVAAVQRLSMMCRPVWEGNVRIGIAEDMNFPTDNCRQCQFMQRDEPLPRAAKARIAHFFVLKPDGDSAFG